MIHWAWLIPAMIVGGIFGIAVTAMCAAAKRGDKHV